MLRIQPYSDSNELLGYYLFLICSFFRQMFAIVPVVFKTCWHIKRTISYAFLESCGLQMQFFFSQDSHHLVRGFSQEKLLSPARLHKCCAFLYSTKCSSGISNYGERFSTDIKELDNSTQSSVIPTSSEPTMVKILNVAEKNDASKNVANILSRGGSNRVSTDNTQV